MLFTYGDIGESMQPCCACTEYTKNHLIVPGGGYYLCRPCMDKLQETGEAGS